MLFIKNNVYDGIVFSVMKEVKFSLETAITNKNLKSLPYLCSRNLPIKIVELAASYGDYKICRCIYNRKVKILEKYGYDSNCFGTQYILDSMRKVGILSGFPKFLDIPTIALDSIEIHANDIDIKKTRPILLYNSCMKFVKDFSIIYKPDETLPKFIEKYCKYNTYKRVYCTGDGNITIGYFIREN